MRSGFFDGRENTADDVDVVENGQEYQESVENRGHFFGAQDGNS